MRRMVVLVLAVIVVGCGHVTGTAQSLQLALKQGDTYKYTVHALVDVTMNMGGTSVPMSVDVSGKATLAVNNVDSSGVADATITLSGVTTKTTQGGVTKTTTGTPSTSVDLKIAPDGHIAGIGGASGTGLPSGLPAGLPAGSAANTNLPGGLVIAVLPDKSVKPGDTWSMTYSLPNPTGSGALQFNTNSSYVTDDVVNGVNAAKVETKANVNVNMNLNLGSLLGPMFQSGGSVKLPSTMPLAPSAMPVMGSSPNPLGALQNVMITLQATGTTDVTTWVEAAQHRVVKSHSTGKLNATITISGVSVPSQAASTPSLSGPMTLVGTELIDINPA